jgi:uncharacterized protein
MYIFLQEKSVRKVINFLWMALFAYMISGAEHCWAEAKIPPTPIGSIYVQDYDNVLSARTKMRINNIGSQLAASTGAQVVVVTIHSLEGMPMEDYSLALFKKWGIGDRQRNNGVLLIMAVKERQTRIEVGYGLEDVLNETNSGQIQDKYIIPYLKMNDYEEGLLNGYLSLTNTLAEYYNVKLDANPAPRHQHNWFMDLWWGLIAWLKKQMELLLYCIAVFFILIFLVIIDDSLFGGFFGRLFPGGSSSDDSQNLDMSSSNSDDDSYGGGSGGGEGSSSDF